MQLGSESVNQIFSLFASSKIVWVLYSLDACFFALDIYTQAEKICLKVFCIPCTNFIGWVSRWCTKTDELLVQEWMYINSFCYFYVYFSCVRSALDRVYACLLCLRVFFRVCVSVTSLVDFFMHSTIFIIRIGLLLLSFSVITIFNDSYANWVKFYGLRVQININYLCCFSFCVETVFFFFLSMGIQCFFSLSGSLLALSNAECENMWEHVPTKKRDGAQWQQR